MNELDLLDGFEWAERLESDEFWWDRAGRRWEVRSMTAQHRANVRRWLRKHANAIHTAVWMDRMVNEPDERVRDAFEDADPITLMRATPIFRALVRADLDRQ